VCFFCALLASCFFFFAATAGLLPLLRLELAAAPPANEEKKCFRFDFAAE